MKKIKTDWYQNEIQSQIRSEGNHSPLCRKKNNMLKRGTYSWRVSCIINVPTDALANRTETCSILAIVFGLKVPRNPPWSNVLFWQQLAPYLRERVAFKRPQGNIHNLLFSNELLRKKKRMKIYEDYEMHLALYASMNICMQIKINL